MLLFAFFSEAGIPKTGLTPKIDVWDSDLNHPVTAQDMTEIAGGFYKYDFASFDNEKDYCIRADGGVSLKDADRYVIAASETVGETEDIKIGTDKMHFSGDDIQARVADKGVLNNPPSENIADYKDKNTEYEIKTAIDNYANKNTYKANVSDMTDILAIVKRAVGLIHENYRLFDLQYDSNSLLISATIRIYPTAVDCNDDTNALAEYLLTAAYVDLNLTSYKVVKV